MKQDGPQDRGGESPRNRLERLSGIVASDRYRGIPLIERFCKVAVDILGMDGAALSLIVDDVHRKPISTFDERSAVIDELQLSLGEGPCLEAYRSGVPILVGNLSVSSNSEWPAFKVAALLAGVGAVFSIPLQAGPGFRLGSLNLYRDRKGDMTRTQLADGKALAQLVMMALVALQRRASPGELRELLSEPAGWGEVHQATGKVAARLGVSLEDAFSRLRARAFSEERPLAGLARDIVQGRYPIDGLES